MIVEEKEAKQKNCIDWMIAPYSDGTAYFCIGEMCMAWKWHQGRSNQECATNEKKGFCGKVYPNE